MKFRLFEFNSKDFPFKKSALKKTWKLFSRFEDGVTLFSWTKINQEIYHLVFHLPDEYISRTKKGGAELSVPFSQYINAFFINGLFYLEYHNKNYTELIYDYIQTEYNLKPTPIVLDNLKIVGILRNANFFIKKLEYEDSEGYDVEKNSPSLEEVIELSTTTNINIEFVTFLYNTTFLSLNREQSTLAIRSSDEEELIEIIEVITDELKNYTSN